MEKTKEPSVEKVIEKLRKIGPSKWKRMTSTSNSYGCYTTELSGLAFDIDCTGHSYDNARDYTLQVYEPQGEEGVTYRENDYKKGEISKFYRDLIKKISAYQDRVLTRKTNSGRKKTLDKLLKILEE